MQPLYTSVKVNNEIELCEINNLECKQLVEKELLKNRISYFIRWTKTGIFRLGKNKDNCIICVHENVKEQAEVVIKTLCDEMGYQVKFIYKRTHNDYL